MAGSSPAMTSTLASGTPPCATLVVIEKGERNDSAYVPDLPESRRRRSPTAATANDGAPDIWLKKLGNVAWRR
jgi:hypothetical protein